MKASKRTRTTKTADSGPSSSTDALVVQKVPQRVIDSYTLTLGSEAQSDTPNVLSFFKNASIFSLSIVFPSLVSPDVYPIAAPNPQHLAQLNNFITQLGPATETIKHLNISLPSPNTGLDQVYVTASDEAIYALLLQFPLVCKHLEQLTVFGRFPHRLLADFGSLCPELSCFHASLAHLPTTTLQQLPTLLPHLTSLGMLRAAAVTEAEKNSMMYRADHANSNTAACIALRACPNMLSFDTTSIDMTAEVWAALPQGLCSCTTVVHGFWSTIRSPPPEWQQHVRLQTLTLTHSSTVSLQELALFLAAAPNLATLLVKNDTLNVSIRKTDGDAAAEQLGLVDSCIQAGLVIAAKDSLKGATRLSRLNLEFDVRHDMMTELLAASLKPLPSFTKMRFHASSENMPGSLLDFSSLFPSLQEVGFMNIDFEEADIEALGACAALRLVEFSVCEGVTRAGLHAMCTAGTSLQQLSCYGCRDISLKDEKAMERKKWCRAVVVYVERGDTLEEEDDKVRRRRHY